MRMFEMHSLVLLVILFKSQVLFDAIVGQPKLILCGLFLIFYGLSPRPNQSNTFLIKNHRAIYSYFLVCANGIMKPKGD